MDETTKATNMKDGIPSGLKFTITIRKGNNASTSVVVVVAVATVARLST